MTLRQAQTLALAHRLGDVTVGESLSDDGDTVNFADLWPLVDGGLLVYRPTDDAGTFESVYHITRKGIAQLLLYRKEARNG